MRREANHKRQPSSLCEKTLRGQSGLQTKLRTSVQNMKHLRIELNRLRSSLSSTCLSYFDRAPYQGTNKDTSSNTVIKKRLSNSPSKLMTKFEHLQSKLEKAKGFMQAFEKFEGQNRVFPKLQFKQSEATCNESKEYILQSYVKKDKPSLKHYASIKNIKVGVKTVSNPYLGRGQQYYISQVARAINEKSSQAMQHINQSIQNLLQYKLIKMNFQGKWQAQIINLPILSPKKKTLYIDLDQTLIHSNQTNPNAADIKVFINLNGAEYKVGFNIRPYTITFLKKIKKKWEIIVFTASHQIYADTVLDQIDPDRQLFDHRLYREHCRELANQFFVKDLSRFNRQLSKSVLVDNSAYSFAMQIDNGIPIFPYYEGKDYELAALQVYLNKLAQQEDVRVFNRKYFQMSQYISFDNNSDLVRQLYCSQKQY